MTFHVARDGDLIEGSGHSAAGRQRARHVARAAADSAASAQAIAGALDALVKNDAAPLRARLHPSIPANGAVNGTQRFLGILGDSLGARIIAFANPTELAAPTRLLHSADGKRQYVDFDAAAGRTTRVTFADSVLTLVVGDAAPITARRG